VSHGHFEIWVDGVQIEIDQSGESLHAILEIVDKLNVCHGISDSHLQDLLNTNDGTDMYTVSGRDPTSSATFRCIKSRLCLGVRRSQQLCTECGRIKHMLTKRKARQDAHSRGQMASKAPLRTASNSKLVRALKRQRQVSRQAKDNLKSVQQKLDSEAVSVTSSMHGSLENILNAELTNPFLKLFWEEQKKNFSRPGNGRRWHPMSIRLALLLHSQSPLAYRSLRQTGVLVLPGESTLRDYVNVVNPSQGFKPEVCLHVFISKITSFR
jgi:transposase-like protein